MAGVLLTILKITGIVLLSIIAFLLLILIIFLFVPVRYKAKGSFKDKIPQAKFSISYLLYILYIVFRYDQGFSYCIRIFGIKLNLKKSKKKSADKADDENPKEEKDTSSDGSQDENDEVEKESFSEKISETVQKIDKAIDILSRDTTKEALEVTKYRIGRSIRSMLPYKGKVYARIGLENAGTTGKILGVYKALYDYIGDVVTFYPVFDSEVIDISFDLKGRIRAITILYHLVRIYMDKNCRRLIKMLIKSKRRKDKK